MVQLLIHIIQNEIHHQNQNIHHKLYYIHIHIYYHYKYHHNNNINYKHPNNYFLLVLYNHCIHIIYSKQINTFFKRRYKIKPEY